MNVSLTTELERLVSDKVATGMYQTASEVVREGLRLLKQRDDLERLRRDVRSGLNSLERGEFEEYDVESVHELATDIKSRGVKRRSKRPKKTTSR